LAAGVWAVVEEAGRVVGAPVVSEVGALFSAHDARTISPSESSRALLI